jgi:adenylate kinase family enzyme
MPAELKNDYPIYLLNYLAELVKEQVLAEAILQDEYSFATFLAALMQGLNSKEEPSTTTIALIVTKRIMRELKGESFNFSTELELEDEKKEKMFEIVERLRKQFTENITTTYVKDFFFAISVYRVITMKGLNFYEQTLPIFRDLVEDIIDEGFRSQRGRTSAIEINIDRLIGLLRLTPAEAQLMEVCLLFSSDVRSIIFRDQFFGQTKNPAMFEAVYHAMIASGLDKSDEAEIVDALKKTSTPIALGIVNYDTKTKRLSCFSDFWAGVLQNYDKTDDEFFSRFIEPIKEKKKSFSGAIAKVASESDEAMLKKFLVKSATVRFAILLAQRLASLTGVTVNETEETLGHNVLLYGPRGLDKIGYVKRLIDSLVLDPGADDRKIAAFLVKTVDARPGDVPSICMIAQRYVLHKINQPTILVIEKAEQALTRQSHRSFFIDMFRDEEGSGHPDKEEMSSDEILLLKNPLTTIWMTNSADAITPENVGRFMFHCELRGGSRKDRREEVQKVCDELKFSPDVAQKLSMYYELNTEQIKGAARMTQFLEMSGAEGEQTLIHLVDNSQKALDRTDVEELRQSVTQYNLDLLNLNGKFPIEKIVPALKKKLTGTLCFYGLPGTGKTALAEYIAMQLDMPLLSKRASDLLDMYLGETEKKIREFFREAKEMGAIAFLDEGDSFLRDRSMATKSWETTQVNELLQQMERFPGIFILATNLFQSIDAAALRRFTFKLEFRELDDVQRLRMLANETGVNLLDKTRDDYVGDAAYEHIWTEMVTIKHLTPGDFATVKRQNLILDETPSLAQWMDMLRIESAAKLQGLIRHGGYSDAEGGLITQRQ